MQAMQCPGSIPGSSSKVKRLRGGRTAVSAESENGADGVPAEVLVKAGAASSISEWGFFRRDEGAASSGNT
jgi:hypothetical protein